jgi:hypothetical protein
LRLHGRRAWAQIVTWNCGLFHAAVSRFSRRRRPTDTNVSL